MAALLKKRALAEFSHVIQEEQTAVKRLKLIQKPQLLDSKLVLPVSTNSQEVLHALLLFEKKLPIDTESSEQNIRTLLDHFYKEKDAAVRVKLVVLLGKLAKTPGVNTTVISDDVCSLLKTEGSHNVVSQLIHVLMVIGLCQPQNEKLHHTIINSTKQLLKNSSHLVRVKCLELIGELARPDLLLLDSNQSEQMVKVMTVLGQYSCDSDSRVRTAAFQAMMKFHQRGHKLELSVYDQACKALTDDYEGVRLSAVKLMWVISHLFPESSVKVPKSDEELRLVDDAFAKICNMVNDLSMKVRAEAAGLLGSLHLVSPKFLDQTLDKKLMSNMRRKHSAHERQKEHFQAGEWSSGQKWADDAPKEQVDAESVSLMSSGACGAFVHGLEDEFYEVRNAAVDSLCELASQSANFAIQCQDYLVDMFNDEIESVRLNAIHSLRKICHHILLREDQVEIVLEILKDCSYDIREGLRDMLCHVQLATTACLKTCMLAMLENLKRYPQDRSSIWRTMRNLGKHHPSLTLPVVPELLSTHPYFDTPEPDMDDPAYISILILVFNAAVDCPTMNQLFPEFTIRHYNYLRETLPQLIPILKNLGSVSNSLQGTNVNLSGARAFLTQMVEKLSAIGDLSSPASRNLLQMIKRDVDRISEVEPELSATAQCLSLCISCQQAMAQCSPSQAAITRASLIEKVIELTYQIQHLFVGLNSEDLGRIFQMRLQAYTILLVKKLQDNTKPEAELEKDLKMYIKRVDALQRFLSINNISADAATQQILNMSQKLDSSDLSSFNTLQPIINQQNSQLIKVNSEVKKATVTIIEPTGTSDNPLKLTAGLTIAVHLNCELEFIKNPQDIRIRVRYPDGEIRLITPHIDHFRQLGEYRHRLITDIILSHTLWSDTSHVEINLVKSYNPNNEVNDLEEDCAEISYITLCKPVKVLVSTRNARR